MVNPRKNYKHKADNQLLGFDMVSEGRGRIFRRKDGKLLVYAPKDLAEDSMFPFKNADSVFVKVSFNLGDNKLSIEKYGEQ